MSARKVICLVIFLVSSVSHAMEPGRAEGVVMIDGSAVQLRFAYGKLAPALRPGAAEGIQVLLTDRSLSPSTLANENEMAKLIKRGELNAVDVRFDDRYQHVRTVVHGKKSTTLSGNSIKVRSTISSRRLVEMKINDAGDDFSIEVTFRTLIGDANVYAPNASSAAALQPPGKAVSRPLEAPKPVVVPRSTPLPRDGGEPARVYLSYHEALSRNDVESVKRLMAAESRSSLEFMKAFKIPMSTLARTKIEIVSGSVQGDRATMNVIGTGIESGARSSGTVNMLKENSVWKVGIEQWQISADEVVAAHGALIRSSVSALTQGSPLPANGGEPGDVWRSYDRAFVRGDLATIRKLIRRQDAAEMDRYPGETLSFQEFRPANIRVVGGVTQGLKATLHLKGTPRDPMTLPVGTVTLVKENGEWKIAAGEDWSRPVEP